MSDSPRFFREAEHELVYNAMLNADALRTIRAKLQPGDFFLPTYRAAFTALCALADRGQEINPVALLRQADGQLDASIIGEMLRGNAMFVRSQDLEYYADVVAESALERQMLSLSRQFEAKILDGESMSATLDSFETQSRNLRVKLEKQREPELADSLSDWLGRLQDVQGQGLTNAIPTGFSQLDSAITGYEKGCLYTVAAGSNEGKTTFALQSLIAAALGPKQAKTAFISLEMPADKVNDRLVQIESGVEGWRFRYQGALRREDWRAIAEAVDRLSNGSLYVVDKLEGYLSEIKTKILELRQRAKIELVVIDYIQLVMLDTVASHQNRTQQLDEIVRGLKRFCVREDIAIVQLSQLTGEAEKTTARTGADVRDSKAIKQASDVLLMLTCQDREAAKMPGNVPYVLDVDKNRYGMKPAIKISFDARLGRFSE